MKFRHTGPVLGFLCLTNLTLVAPSDAAPVNWNQLDKIQQHVVLKHKEKWNSYREEKQNRVLLKHGREIAKLRWYKVWVKSRSESEQKEIERIKRKHGMNSLQLKMYIDKLMRQPK